MTPFVLLSFGLVQVAHRSLSGLERGISSLAATSGIVQIDVENVRGKSGFRLDHSALLAATAQWTAAHKLQGRVVLVVDLWHPRLTRADRDALGVMYPADEEDWREDESWRDSDFEVVD